jgi:hypothetical protein
MGKGDMSNLGQEIFRIITNKLGRETHIAVRPDHPMLLAGPDVFLALPGNLVSLFIPKQQEIADPDKLLVRLALSRLALPSHAKWVLLIPRHLVSWGYSNQVARNFHETIDEKGISQLRTFLVSPPPDKISPIPEELRKKVNNRFEDAYRTSTESFSAERKREGKRVLTALAHKQKFIMAHVPRLVPRETTASGHWKVYMDQGESEYLRKQAPARSIVEKDDVVLGELDTPRIQSFSYHSMRLNENLFRLTYTLDNGIPYFKKQKLVSLLQVTSVPTNRFDPMKPLRVLAFAGWHVVHADSPEGLMNEVVQAKERVGELNE